MVDKTPGFGPNGDCWRWKGSPKSGIYGRLRGEPPEKPHLGAHRVAWFVHYGKWPSEDILHKCDTPRCVRWDHLFEGTQKDNVADAMMKGRWTTLRGKDHPNTHKTHCKRGHVYDEKNTYQIRGERHCRQCQLIAVLKYQENLRAKTKRSALSG